MSSAQNKQYHKKVAILKLMQQKEDLFVIRSGNAFPTK